MVDIFFHSDDAGATAEVTRCILEAWQQRLLTSFSVIANGDACDTVSHVLAAHPDLHARVMVHLNLSEGAPCSSQTTSTSLLNDKGILKNGFFGLLIGWLFQSSRGRKDLIDQIRVEWREQIRITKQLVAPRPVAGVDGHNHVHMLPFLFPVAAELAAEEGLPEIRISLEHPFVCWCSRETWTVAFAINMIKHIVLRACSAMAKPAASRQGLTSPDAVVGVLYTGMPSVTSVRSGVAHATKRGARRIEAVFHVGRAAESESSRWTHLPASRAFFLSPWRDREMACLRELKKSPP